MSYTMDWKIVIYGSEPANVHRFIKWISEGAWHGEVDAQQKERSAIAARIMAGRRRATRMGETVAIFGDESDCPYSVGDEPEWTHDEWDAFIDDVIEAAPGFSCEAAYAHVGEDPDDDRAEWSEGGRVYPVIERRAMIHGVPGGDV